MPHDTLSSWDWHNDSLPTAPNQTLMKDFTGVDGCRHDRLPNYEQGNEKVKEFSQWLIANPHGVNL